jgi:ATP-dependent Clp protease adaptor protein ClpS
MGTITKKEEKEITKNILSKPFKIILHNDDYNTFEWVIDCLIRICGHEFDQANQCAHIVHYKGECDVKYGDFDTLSKMKEKLTHSGLLAPVEKN